MGNQGPALSRDKQAKMENRKQEISTDFQACFQKWQSNSNFLNELMRECPIFTKNVQKIFPNAKNSYRQFVEMVNFLHKNGGKAEYNQFAKHNSLNTNLFQRFIMIVMDIQRYQQLQQRKVSNIELQNVFTQFMKIFIKSPQSGYFPKLSKYLSLPSEPISLREFTSSCKQYFPATSKHLSSYFISKFRDLNNSFLVLQNFSSAILQQDSVILSLKLPELSNKQIKCLYSSDTNGLSFHSYQKRIIGYDGPWLLLIEHSEKQGTYKFGTFQSGPIRDVIQHQGDLRGFMFSIQPNIRYMTTDKGEQGEQFFCINTIDEKVSKRRRGLGFGGDKSKSNYKLWIDQDMDKSTVFNGNDPTYGFGALANPMSNNLSIKRMQIWGLGSKYDLQKQALYWQEREEQALKRRKVNKKEFFDGNAGMMFEKTFAHRDQVVGEIQRKQQK